MNREARISTHLERTQVHNWINDPKGNSEHSKKILQAIEQRLLLKIKREREIQEQGRLTEFKNMIVEAKHSLEEMEMIP